MRVLIVEDEPYLAEAVRDGLRLDPFSSAIRITVSALRKRLGESRLIATVPGVGYRIDADLDSGPHA